MSNVFTEALNKIGPGGAPRLISAARPEANYLFNTLLPERNVASYYIDNSAITIRPTMAGLTGENSPYAPGGVFQASSFLERLGKFSVTSTFKEGSMRQLQEIIRSADGNATDVVVTEALNWYNKVVVQGLLDRAEWLRGQALVNGRIKLDYNDKHLNVDYNVPSDYKGTHRTGNNAYDKPDSKFWADHIAATSKLGFRVRAIIMHPNTYAAVIANPANNASIIEDSTGFTIAMNTDFGVSTDPRYRARVIVYGDEGEVIDTSGDTVRVPFMPEGKILYVGDSFRSGYTVGQGSVEDEVDGVLGYYHVGPTVEGGGAVGRWGNIYIPEDRPMEITARGVENGLPVREDLLNGNAGAYVLSTKLGD